MYKYKHKYKSMQQKVGSLKSDVMGCLIPNLGGKEMESKPGSSSTKIERKIIEKNRRNYMKNLYNNLNSLLPHSKVSLTLSFDSELKNFHI